MLMEFASFLRFRVKGHKRFEYSTCGFENEKKKISFQKYPDTCGSKTSYLIWFNFFNRINFLKHGFV